VLPACCPHAARVLPARCPRAARMLRKDALANYPFLRVGRVSGRREAVCMSHP
jgi:hypothetical protein